MTRAPVDYRYNCWGDYTAPPVGLYWAVAPLTGGQEIDGCTGSGPAPFDNTAVYMSRTSQVRMSGGSGSLTWIAPGTGDFDDLALWSDSPLTQFLAGQASLAMEGVFSPALRRQTVRAPAGRARPTPIGSLIDSWREAREISLCARPLAGG